ncbi:unnamed protein product, partial [Owenia fusiformis]
MADEACPNGWYECDGRCYGLFINQTHNLTWIEARESCWSKDAFLAAITTTDDYGMQYGREEEACIKETLLNWKSTEPLPCIEDEPKQSVYAGLMTGARTCDLLVTTINVVNTSEVNITWSQAECREHVTDTFMCVKMKKTNLDRDNNLPCPARRPCECIDSLYDEGSVVCHRVGLLTMPIDVSPNASGIYASNNRISYIESGMFHGMSHIQHLSLDMNVIREISSFGFKGLNKLESLSIKDNRKPLKLMSRSFGGLHELKMLKLSLMFRLDYPVNDRLFQDLTSLHTLHIMGCDIKRIEDVFLPNPHLLRSLRTNEHNILDSMFRNPTNYSNLEVLSLHGPISDRQFDGMNKLKILHLLNVDILRVQRLKPAMFVGLDSLKELLISCNIRTIEQETFTPLKNIEKISIYLDTLPKYPLTLFQGLEKLTEVKSDHMELCCIVPTT